MVWPQEMVRVLAPSSRSRCQVRSEVRRIPPSWMRLTWQDMTSPT